MVRSGRTAGSCFRRGFPLYQRVIARAEPWPREPGRPSAPNPRLPDEDRPMTQKYQVIGTRPIRHDGLDKVTGRALYGADLQLSGMLHGRVLRSPHAHALIHGIDVSAALKLPGVE